MTIPEAIRERVDERYRLVELEDDVKCVPIPDEPVVTLRDAASEECRAASMGELGDAALEAGRERAAENVR